MTNPLPFNLTFKESQSIFHTQMNEFPLALPAPKSANGNGETKPAGQYTGQLLLRTRPKTYYKIVHLLAEGRSSIGIARECRVSPNSVEAVAKRRSAEIEERKKTIVGNLSDVAELGSERMVSLIGKSALRDATIGTGVAVDKILALTGQLPPAHVAFIMPSEQERAEMRAMDAKLDAIAARLRIGNAQSVLP